MRTAARRLRRGAATLRPGICLPCIGARPAPPPRRRMGTAAMTASEGLREYDAPAPRCFELKSRRYMGCKTRITRFIRDAIAATCGSFGSFCDPFAGTGAVSQAFNDRRTRIISNDHLFSNYVALRTFLGAGRASREGLHESIRRLNALPAGPDNYFSRRYGGTFFTVETARKIGAVRDGIEAIASDDNERCALICSLLYAMDRLANTVGHYDAYRSRMGRPRPLVLAPPCLGDPGANAGNLVCNMDANELVRRERADVLYLDPPYNSRQYCDAYHLLENTATWKKPETSGKAQKMDRSHLKSRYCLKDAADALEDLVMHADCGHIFLSYNNTSDTRDVRSNSRISDEAIRKILEKRGPVTVHETSHREFAAGRTDPYGGHAERLFACTVSRR